jgi:serine/threonine protein kinase
MEDFASLFRQTPGQRIRGRYMVQETLAASRVSTVYRVLDAQSGTACALKELTTTALFRPEERREAELALQQTYERWSELRHPALPRLFALHSEPERHYVVMEFVPGLSLKRIIVQGRLRVTPDLARNWGAQLCGLLSYLHEQEPPQLVPFLAPGHIMVTPEGEVKLVDLGLTRFFSAGSYGPLGSIRGYAAPELGDGVCDARSDLFSLGRVLYALLIGRLLETRPPQQLPLSQVVPGISTQLVKVIARAAHRDLARRFGSARELREALWDELSGPLTPLADWMQQALAAQPSPVPATRALPSASDVLVQAGYERDARFVSPVPVEPSPAGEARARLSVHPHSYEFGDLQPAETRRLVLSVRNSGDGELVGHVTSHVSWITAPTRVWRLPPGKQAKLILSVHAGLLAPGRTTEPQAVSIETNGGRQWIGVTADIPSGPALNVEQPILDFGSFQGGEERSLPLGLGNRGRQPLSGSVASRVPWLRVPQATFRCPPGQTTRVAVTIVPERLPRGQQQVPGALLVDSDGGQEQVEVRAWRTRPELDIGATHMDFGALLHGEVAERFLYVGNSGDSPLEGTVRSVVPWLQVSPREFTCAPGEMAQVTVSADSVGLPDGALDLPQAVRLQSNGGAATLSLHMLVHAPRMALETAELAFGNVPLGEARERQLTIRNDGSAQLQASLQPLVPWLVLSQNQVVCEPDQRATITVRADTAAFTHGQEIIQPAALRLVSGASITEVPASMIVLQPSLRVEPTELDFGYVDRAQPEAVTLSVHNDGTGKLAWNAQTDAVWVEFSERSGVCEAGESTRLTVTAYGLALESGVDAAKATLVINSDGGRAKIPLRIALAAPRLEIDTVFLDLGRSVNLANVNGSFRVFNRGLGLLRGSIASGETWLTVDRASFECPMGRSVEVRVSTDMEEFPKDALRASGLVRVLSSGGTGDVEASVQVVLAPQLMVAGEAVEMAHPEPDQPFQGRLVVRNVGRATAHTQLEPSTPAIVLSRTLCDIKPGKSVRIAVHWEGGQPAEGAGHYIGITSGEQQLRVPVRLSGGTWPVTAAHTK